MEVIFTCIITAVSLLVAMLSIAHAQIETCDLFPPKVEACFRMAETQPVNLKAAHINCLREHYINYRPDLNLTKADQAFFNLRAIHGYGYGPPPTGFRVRKEYRRLTKKERYSFHAAFNELYRRGTLAHFGRLHTSAVDYVHGGPAFLPWHRVFITDFEEELRRIDPSVSLPYWDVTLDNNMTRPSDSVLWTRCFLGNGNGTIIKGPFKNWYGARSGPIQRDYASPDCDSGRLMNKLDVDLVLSKCTLLEISEPQDDQAAVLEYYHNGIHSWVGGDMGDTFTASFDPVFYLLHAYIDKVWEVFRRKQATVCAVNPIKDYPPDFAVNKERQRAMDMMYGYPHMQVIDGLSAVWIDKYYNYEDAPRCPDCGSPYLYCDLKQQICVSRDYGACPGGREYVNSRARNTYTQYPKVRPSIGPRTDGRNRDTSLEECARILYGINDKGKGFPPAFGFDPFSFGPGSFGQSFQNKMPPLSFSSLYSPFWSGLGSIGTPKIRSPFDWTNMFSSWRNFKGPFGKKSPFGRLSMLPKGYY